MTTILHASVGLLLLAGSPAAIEDDLAEALRRADFAALDVALQSPAAHTLPIIDAVQRELTNPTPAVRQLAAYALSELDPERGRQAVPALVEALQNPEPRVRARLALA